MIKNPRTKTDRPSLLSATEEVDLAKRIEAGSEAHARLDAGLGDPGDVELAEIGDEARKRFMEANLGLVMSIARKTRLPGHVDPDDVVQDGMVGLERAVTKFDWRRGYKFSTYATWWIRKAIHDGLENTASTVRIPSFRAAELRSALARSGDSTNLRGALASAAAMSSLESIDRPTTGGQWTISDVVPSGHVATDRLIDAMEDRALLATLLRELDEISSAAIVARFGLDGSAPKTFASIGEQLGTTGEAARRRVVRTLAALRRRLEELGFEGDAAAA